MSTGVTFGWYDYLLFAAILAISLAIGLGLGLAKGRQKTTKEFLLANRNLGELPSSSQQKLLFFPQSIAKLHNAAYKNFSLNVYYRI